jgi:hypothetical protein
VSRSRPHIVAALTDPGIYPHAVDRVELVETHISWVFLAGDRVYKVKKPVDLGFLDFTTLERRRFFCEEEIRLNRRLDARLDLPPQHRARYEPPDREPNVIRIDTTADVDRAAAKAVGDLGR